MKISIILAKIDIFAPKFILRKTPVTLPQSLHNMILSVYLKIHSFDQNLALFVSNNIVLQKENTTKN